MSPWALPLVPVKKKDGRTRWVTDLREFNKQTVKDSYSLKNIQEIVHSLQGATVFSSLDACRAYHAVRILIIVEVNLDLLFLQRVPYYYSYRQSTNNFNLKLSFNLQHIYIYEHILYIYRFFQYFIHIREFFSFIQFKENFC